METPSTGAIRTLKNGERHSTARAFSTTAKDRSNFHVIKYAHVEKIRLDSANKVTGLEFAYKKSHQFIAKARKEYILSAGAVSTPQILMLSGIGPKDHLQQFGIPVKLDSIGVGKNLLDHVIVPIVFQFDKSTAQPEKPTDLLDNLYNDRYRLDQFNWHDKYRKSYRLPGHRTATFQPETSITVVEGKTSSKRLHGLCG